MPNLDSEADTDAAIASLSPMNDGSPDPSLSGNLPGQANSDRRLFLAWLKRLANHEADAPYVTHYEPFPIPATIGAAITDQRAFEAEERAKADAADAASERQRAQEAAQEAAEQRARERQRAEQEAKDQAELVKVQAEHAATAAAEEAKLKERMNRDAVDTARQKAAYDCRMHRQEAASAALKEPNAIEQRAYQRVYDSFKCDPN